MKTEYQDKLRINEFGDLDVNYYIIKGKQLRSEALSAMLKGIIAKLRFRQAKAQPMPLKPNFRH